MKMLKGSLLILFTIILTACVATSTSVETIVETTTIAETKESIIIIDDTKEEEEVIPDERVEVDGKIRSYLDGTMKDVSVANRRPIAVMMSNDKAALPQYGINDASIVYEANVEGVMNRFMALIEDYDDLERIGSVRSARTYYTYFAREWDAIFAHYGQSTFAKPYLSNVDNINGLDGIGTVAYYRSSDKKTPHNAYTSGERLKKAIEQLGYSTEYDTDYTGNLQFAKPGENVILENSLDAIKIVPGYTFNAAYFTYNKESGEYLRFQYDAPHNGDKGQISVKNIILEYFPTGYYATTEYLNINVHQDTVGYYITEGKAIVVTVKKDGEFGVTHYYNSDGEEIKLNAGKTWICVVNAANISDTKLYDDAGEQTN